MGTLASANETALYLQIISTSCSLSPQHSLLAPEDQNIGAHQSLPLRNKGQVAIKGKTLEEQLEGEEGTGRGTSQAEVHTLTCHYSERTHFKTPKRHFPMGP